MAQPREASLAVIRFSGRQVTSINPRAAKTDEATIAVGIGHVILYFHHATPLLKIRHGLSRINLKTIPRGTQPLASRALTVSAELHETDAAAVHLVQRPGTPPYVRIQAGLVALDAVDRDAFVCLAQTLHTAAMLAREHFLEPSRPLDGTGRAHQGSGRRRPRALAAR